ncbi:beta-lactamase hydrolase domain-containing protein [Acinetobacter silvestris]|uniref:Beta-lactamase hydrolase-like protein phosphatase-like domain-containing protein n=1 Tax=Acinetobacter silvestris TaxID=1977882 RepID=A0A1Y3CC81_9GAMM|nr:sulfur transferase domain-containing protein [Acinetobacter silvestris]OTG64657.1 hypothetical protein B9T28_10655 [Acinetobacter silvestris]
MTKSFISLVFCCCLIYTHVTYAENVDLSRALATDVSVSGEMTTDKFQKLIALGFKSVVVNRPDDEQGNLTTAHQLRNISEKSKVSLIYQPISSGQISQSDIIEFSKYYNSLPKPILMICKTGSRSTTLFNNAKSQGLLNE